MAIVWALRSPCLSVAGTQVESLQSAERTALKQAAASHADMEKLQTAADGLKRDLEAARAAEAEQQSVR